MFCGGGLEKHSLLIYGRCCEYHRSVAEFPALKWPGFSAPVLQGPLDLGRFLGQPALASREVAAVTSGEYTATIPTILAMSTGQ